MGKEKSWTNKEITLLVMFCNIKEQNTEIWWLTTISILISQFYRLGMPTLFSWIILLFHVVSTEVIQWYSDVDALVWRVRDWFTHMSIILEEMDESTGPTVTVKKVFTDPLFQQWSRKYFIGTWGISDDLLRHRNESCHLLNSGARNQHSMTSAMFYLSK